MDNTIIAGASPGGGANPDVGADAPAIVAAGTDIGSPGYGESGDDDGGGDMLMHLALACSVERVGGQAGSREA